MLFLSPYSLLYSDKRAVSLFYGNHNQMNSELTLMMILSITCSVISVLFFRHFFCLWFCTRFHIETWLGHCLFLHMVNTRAAFMDKPRNHNHDPWPINWRCPVSMVHKGNGVFSSDRFSSSQQIQSPLWLTTYYSIHMNGEVLKRVLGFSSTSPETLSSVLLLW